MATLTLAELCDTLGCSPRSVALWVGDGMPILHRGGQGQGDESQFDSAIVHRWLVDQAVARATRDRPDVRLKQAQAERAEMELARAAGRLVFVEDVEKLWTEAVIAARGELVVLADRLKGKLDATYRINVDPALIETEVLQALRKLSDQASGPDEAFETVSRETPTDGLGRG